MRAYASWITLALAKINIATSPKLICSRTPRKIHALQQITIRSNVNKFPVETKLIEEAQEAMIHNTSLLSNPEIDQYKSLKWLVKLMRNVLSGVVCKLLYWSYNVLSLLIASRESVITAKKCYIRTSMT